MKIVLKVSADKNHVVAEIEIFLDRSISKLENMHLTFITDIENVL